MFGISAISLGLIILFILQVIYDSCWSSDLKMNFGFIGILILLITLINFPVGYFFKEKITLKRFNVNIIFYSLIITGTLIGFGIVRIVLSTIICN